MTDTPDRYKRHRQIKGLSQEALSDAHVIILGAGATGNELLKNLTLLGVGTLEVFDRDTIEGHNLTRSVLFRDTDINESKVEVAAARAREIDPHITVIAHHGDLYETLTLDRILKADCVIIGLDAMEPRLRVNQLCLLAGVPLINTAIDHRSVRVSWHPFHLRAREKAIGCLACNLSPNVFDNIAARYSCGALRKELATDGLIPTTIITSSLAASMAVSLLTQFLHDEAPADAWTWSMDSKTGKVREYITEQDELCPYCVSSPTNRTIIPWGPQYQTTITGLLEERRYVALLDALIDAVVCPSCHAAESPDRVHRTPAYLWTDRLMICPTCDNRAREVSRITALTTDDAAYFCEHPYLAPLVAFEQRASEAGEGDNPAIIVYRKAGTDT